jgi:hypothetical protein
MGRRMDMNKAAAELDVLRGFIDFVNRQVFARWGSSRDN